MPIFDWRPRFDERSRAFPIRSLVAEPPRSKNWRCRPRLDQGYEGACVGFGWAHSLASKPRFQAVDAAFARVLYADAKTLDAWPGEDYSGTSVLAGAKAAQRAGRISEYRWAFGLDDVLGTLAWVGPVVVGVNWYDGMLDTVNDEIRVTGGVVGGHCVCLHGVRVSDRTVRVRNSWGATWGMRGDAYLGWDDLARLLAEDGEACVPTKAAWDG